LDDVSEKFTNRGKSEGGVRRRKPGQPRYLYFAQKADVEGHNDVSAVFRSTAEGETGRAHGHLEFLEEVGDPVTGKPIGATDDNLRAAIAGETHEYREAAVSKDALHPVPRGRVP
jgi:rubrerythrin